MSKKGPTSMVDEREPLLSPATNLEDARVQAAAVEQLVQTPLPKLQMTILLLLQLVEPMTSQVIYPFINQLVSELDITGGDPKKVGYYAGLIESLFFVTQAMFVFSWSRASDRVGRKPVLMMGLAGLGLSMMLFGLSRTFWTLVASRALNGMLNANIGVIKSMTGEITDSTNVAQAFAFIPIAWSAGATIGPFIGGNLARPHDHFPNTFTNQFWTDFPYFLPCFVSAVFAGFAFVITGMFLKESVQKSSQNPFTEVVPETRADDPLPLRSLMTRPILLSVVTYCCIALSDICFFALQPLFYSTSIELGGLGLSTSTIGSLMAIFGIINGIIQILFFPRIVRYLGPKLVIVMGMFLFVPIFSMFPVLNQFARSWGLSPGIWMLLTLQLLLMAVMDMAFSAVFIFVTSSAPNKRSLGSINGMAQTMVSIARAIGPVTSTSLFAASLQNNWLGGNAVYLVLMVLPAIGLLFASRLPRQAWKYRSM